MKQMVQKFSQWLGRATPSDDFQQATMEDVLYCYRLLLSRPADPGELKYYSDLIANHDITVGELVDAFLGRAEFRELARERTKPVSVSLPDFTIFVRSSDHFVGGVIAKQKVYEPHVSDALQEMLHPGDTFLDIGANIGYFTLLAAAKVGNEGQVLAFEPQRANCELIERSVAANGFQNVTVYANAVAEKEETFLFTDGGVDSNGRLINPHEPQASQNSLPVVQTIVLDEVLSDLPRLDVVKMDIEGAEPRAYAGTKQLLARHAPTMIMEFSPDLIRTTSETDPSTFLQQLMSRFALHAILLGGGRVPITTMSDVHHLLQRNEGTHLDLLCRPR